MFRKRLILTGIGVGYFFVVPLCVTGGTNMVAIYVEQERKKRVGGDAKNNP